jgi:hypothetical protein
MSDQLDIEELLKMNPQISPEALKESMAQLCELRKQGLRRRGYRLAPPGGGPRPSVIEDPGEIKIARLRSSSQRP